MEITGAHKQEPRSKAAVYSTRGERTVAQNIQNADAVNIKDRTHAARTVERKGSCEFYSGRRAPTMYAPSCHCARGNRAEGIERICLPSAGSRAES